MKILQPTFENIIGDYCAGVHRSMSLSVDHTFEMWRSFMPRLKEFQNRVGTDLYSIQIFPPGIQSLGKDDVFEKWAAVKVGSPDSIPSGMDYISLEGTYVRFVHEGPMHTFHLTLQSIFGNWLPSSGYQLDDRPHFEIMPEGYDRNDPQAKEFVFIPVKLKR